MTTVQDDAAISATTEIREGEYGDKVAVIEPGGAEFIPLNERHGKPSGLFWTWMSPNFEFATVFVGVLAVAGFGETLEQSIAAIVLGTVLGSVTMGALSARGPQYGVPQMILSRISFGYWGNTLPAGLNAITAGVGWFAVNSVSGALALNTLLHFNKYVCLVIIVAAQILIALYGHNMVHLFEKFVFPLLIIAFGLGAIWTFSKAHYGHVPQVRVHPRRVRRLHPDSWCDVRLCSRLEPVRVGLHPLHGRRRPASAQLHGGAGLVLRCPASRWRSWARHQRRCQVRTGWMVRARSCILTRPWCATSSCSRSRSARSRRTC